MSVPSDRSLVGYKWLLKIKKNANGTIARNKARLVAQGYSQALRLDYRETFSLVVKANTMQIVLALATSRQWKLRQVDVNNVFDNLIKEIYMKQSPRFEVRGHDGSSLACKFSKALYGLKQAPRA